MKGTASICLDGLAGALVCSMGTAHTDGCDSPFEQTDTPKAVYDRLTVGSKMAGRTFHLKGPAHPYDGSAVQPGAGCSGAERTLDTLPLLPVEHASEQARAA